MEKPWESTLPACKAFGDDNRRMPEGAGKMPALPGCSQVVANYCVFVAHSSDLIRPWLTRSDPVPGTTGRSYGALKSTTKARVGGLY